MEPDSTTIEQESDSPDDKESSFVEELSKSSKTFREEVLPLTAPDRQGELLAWMQQNGLLVSSVACASDECSVQMIKTRVVDKYQWKCGRCSLTWHVRARSFFDNVHCQLAKSLVVLFAWCQDVDCDVLTNILGVKKQTVVSLYEKIEKAIFSRPTVKLGGPNNVLLVELYPEFVDELYPVSSKNETAKSQHRILCLADTTKVPTQYWLHVITGFNNVPTDNNNTKLKKVSLTDEVLHILSKITSPGGLCAIGGGAQLDEVRAKLKENSLYEGITSMSNLTARANSDMQSFLTKSIWKPVKALCEASQDLHKNKVQTYLSCALWRWQTDADDTFKEMIRFVSQHNRNASDKTFRFATNTDLI